MRVHFKNRRNEQTKIKDFTYLKRDLIQTPWLSVEGKFCNTFVICNQLPYRILISITYSQIHYFSFHWTRVWASCLNLKKKDKNIKQCQRHKTSRQLNWRKWPWFAFNYRELYKIINGNWCTVYNHSEK